MWNRWLFLTCTLQLGGSTTKTDRRSSAETRTTCSRLPPTTASKTGTPRVRIAAHDIDYLVHYRGSSANAAAKTLSTGQRLLSAVDGRKSSYSTTKRSLGDAVRALGWYRQFREIVLMFAITNIEPLCEPL